MLHLLLARTTVYWAGTSEMWLRVDAGCHLGAQLGLWTRTSTCDLSLRFGFLPAGLLRSGKECPKSMFQERKQKLAVVLERLGLALAVTSFCSVLFVRLPQHPPRGLFKGRGNKLHFWLELLIQLSLNHHIYPF